ncbi:hypothetical protein F5B21DRAFT_454603 [Xylaria acuta]|nr:hypothetical protein F5B21DRAFT_454603 [Xylaria acuta]
MACMRYWRQSGRRRRRLHLGWLGTVPYRTCAGRSNCLDIHHACMFQCHPPTLDEFAPVPLFPCSLARRDLPTNGNAAGLRLANASCHILVRRPYSTTSHGTGTALQSSAVLGRTRLVPRSGCTQDGLEQASAYRTMGRHGRQPSRMQHPGV